MGRTSLQDVRLLGDPLFQHNWDIIFPNFPGSPSSRDMSYRAMSTNIPGTGLEKVAVPLHGVELEYAGRATYTHSWQATFLETRDVGFRDKMIRWMKLARSWKDNTGSYKNVYGTTIQLVLYDDIPSVVRTINIYGAFPETLDDSAVDGAQSAAVTTGATFAFDWFDDV